MFDLRVLGGFEVRANRPDGTPGVLTQPKRLALLLYLALASPPGLHARDRLLALLWPDGDDGSSRHSLRNALHALRHVLGDDAIVTRGESFVGLDFRSFHCDALALRAHLAAGRAEDALALWTGELAPGFHVSGAPDFERWLEEQRAELHRAVRTAAWTRARELEGCGPSEVNAVRRAVRLDPDDEPGARRLMRLLAEAGDRGGALHAYRELADHLARELETEPSAETRALAAELRSAAPTAAGAVAAATRPARRAVPGVAVDEPPPPASLSIPRTASSGARRRRMTIGTIAGAFIALLVFGGSYLSGRAPSASAPRDDAGADAQRAVLRLPARYRADTAAYSSYLRGLTLRFQFRFRASRDTLAALVAREPLYVPGLYGLAHADIYTAINDLTDPDESWPQIDALARRALALDSTAASAWLALATEDMFWRLDLPLAGERIARARMLDSLDPDVAGMRSVWFRFQGQMDSAVAEARLAHRLDPLSPLYARLVGKQLFFARRYEESRRVFEGMLGDDPGWTRGYEDASELYGAMGRPREAVAWLGRSRAAAGDSAGAAALPADVSSDSAALRLLAADAWRSIRRYDSARRGGERVPAWRYVVAYATLRDTATTFRWLDSVIVRHDSYLHRIRVDPIFDFLRSDARYRAWDARTGLPPIVR